MMKDFYSRTRSLYEEFQRREERFHDSEQKWKSFKLKRDLETQECLQRIEQTEKETEKAFREIINQMDDFDRRADLLLLELDQLDNVQNTISSHTDYTPSGLETNLLFYSTVENPIPKSSIPHFTLESLVESSSSKCESTQTENANCEKCSSFNTLQHFLPNNEIPSEGQSEKSIMGFSKLHNISESLITKESLLSTDKPLSDTNSISAQKNTDFHPVSSSKNFTIQENPKINIEDSEKHFFPSPVSTNDHPSLNVNNEDTLSPLRNEAVPHTITTDNNQENILSNTNTPLKLQMSEYDSTETKLGDSESNTEAFTPKSDAESVNNEFDFLESDTKNTFPKKKTQKNSKTFASQSDKSNIKIDEKHKKFGKQSAKPFEDDKSETSGSVSGPQSPTMSLASDSESIHDKESPSTAYEKLLRNTVIPKNTQASTLESESEDEVEKALASSAQRTNLKPKNSVSVQNDKSVLLQPESKSQTKESSTSFSSIPKLSKNTKKILGMDSSSGSEIELAVRPPNRNDVDDDEEFDSFFN